jgi:tRNA(fMet)-specific endonuclease VapC
MPQFLFDTDHLTLYGQNYPPVVQRWTNQPADAVGISAVTVEELLRGRLAVLRRHRSGPSAVQAYAWLVKTVSLCNQFPVVPFDLASDSQFQQLLSIRPRIGTRDLKIRAIALVNNLVLLTRNRRDFGRIPGLKSDDWSV